MRLYGVVLLVLIFMISLSAVSATDDFNATDDMVSIPDDLSTIEDTIISEEVISKENDEVLASNNSVIYADVENGNDSNDGLSKDTPVRTIAKAYDLADSNGIIYLADGVYPNPRLFLYKSLSIIGSNNTIIDGGNTYRSGFVFRTWSGSYFAFKNIKFMDVKTFAHNAKVIQAGVKGSTVVIDNCDFIDTNVNLDDATSTPVIRIGNSVTAYILNCNFINPNKGTKNYCTIYSSGAKKLVVNNTNFINASNGFIFSERGFENFIPNLEINNCNFINVSHNGAIRCDTRLLINNSSFINCSNDDTGGAVYIDRGSNKKINPIITNCYFENCYSSSNGGAIAVYNANSFNLLNSSFVGCSCSYWNGFGGALYISKNTNAYLNHDVFSECSGKGAAIYNGGNTVLNNSIVENSKIDVVTNMYGYHLGSILNDYGTLTVVSSIFENNVCLKSWYPGSRIGTAGIYNRGTLDVSYSAFINNTIIGKDMFNDVYTESSGVKSIDFNWWGSDENPVGLSLSNYEKINNWFYLDIVPEYLALNINDTGNVSANFKLNNPNIPFDSSKVPMFNITFSSMVNDKLLYECKNLVNNSASVLFNLTQSKGQYILLTSIGAYFKLTIVDVGKNVSVMGVDYANITYGENLMVNVSVKDNQSQSLNGNVTFQINKKTYNVKLTNGYCTSSISGLDPGNYTLKVIYEGNEDYFKSIQYFNVSVTKIPTNISIFMPEVIYIGNKAVFNTTLSPENFKIRANLYLNGEKTNILYIYGGNTTISLGVRPVGEYNITVELWNHTYYESSTVSKSFRVEKYDVDLTMGVDDVKIGENATIIINSYPEDFKGYAVLEINGVNQSVYISNGQTNVTVSDLGAGKYDLKLYYEGDAKFKNATAYSSFNVLRNAVALNISVGEGFVVVETNYTDCSGLISLYVNNHFYSQNLSDGVCNFSVDFEKGYNYIYAYYLGDDYYEYAVVNTTFLVPDTPGLIGEDLIVYEHSGEGYVINLNNELGYPIVNATIFIAVGGKKYGVVTNWEGYALLPLDLDVGDYLLYASYGRFNVTNNISVKPINLRLSLKDIIAQDQVQTISAKVSKGVLGKISFELSNGNSYVVDINANGIAQVNISDLDVGNYSVKAFYFNEIYDSSHVFANFSVYKYYTPISLDLNDTLHGRDVLIKVTLPDDAKGNVLFIVNNNSYVMDVVGGISLLNLSALDVGKYSLDIYYSGDNHYYNTSILNKEFKVFKYDSVVGVNVFDVYYGRDVIISVNVSGNAAGNVNIKVNSKSYTVKLVNSKAQLTLSDLEVGYYTVDVDYVGDIYYNSNSSNADFNVYKLDTFVNVGILDVLAGEDEIITVNLEKDATGTVTFVVDGKKYIKNVDNASAVLVLSNLKVKTYNLCVYYSGDSHYNSNQSNLTFSIKSSLSSIDIMVSDVEYLQKIIIKANVTVGASGNVIFIVNNMSKTVNLVNSTAVWEIDALNAGTYEVTAKYVGDDVYLSSMSSKSFNVYRAESSVDVVVNSVVVGENIRIYAVVSPNATGNVTFRMLGYYSPKNKTINGNNASWLISPLKTGQYTIIAIYNGDNNYLSSNTTYYLSVNQIKTKLNVEINNVSKKSDVLIKASLKTVNGDNIDGQIMLSIGEYDYIVDIVGGYGVLNISKLNPGVYNYSALYGGSKLYYRSTFEGFFVVEDSFEDVKLIVNPLVKYYSGDERLIVYLTDDMYNPIENASLYISINGVEYKRVTDAGGFASMGVNLNSGNYAAYIRFEGLNKFNALSASVDITVNPTVEGLNITKIFRNATQYYAIFCDNQGNLLKNTSVNFNINGVFYERTTNDFGIARLNINLEPGSYILTAENPVTHELRSNLITVLSNIVENHDLTKYYKNDSQYVVKLLGSNGKAVAGEEVTFNINGVFYTRVSDDDGYVRLNINLNPGNYIITAEHNGCMVSNNIVVKPVLFTNDLSFRYGSFVSFEATLVDGQGKYYPNQIITFNINGVFYERTTNDNGVASLNIRLQVGKYIITSIYDGCNVANTITIY